MFDYFKGRTIAPSKMERGEEKKRKERSSKQISRELDFLFTQRQLYYIYTYLLASYQIRTNLSTDYVMLILHIKDDPAGSLPA